jgi:hypothetical protein
MSLTISPQLYVSPELLPSIKLYRTMDFFGASAMHSERTLMFTRADLFEDKNEGIDRLLGQIEAALPNSGCGMGWSDLATAKKEHERLKRSHYISCWSREAESVAMWSLYSSDLCSVRVSTSLSKLVSATSSLAEKYSIARLRTEPSALPFVATASARIEPVVYESLATITRVVSRRASARTRLFNQFKRTGRPIPTIDEINPRYWEREKQRRFNELRTTCRLKDSSFLHEAEIRLNVRVGELKSWRPDQLNIDHLDPAHAYHDDLIELLKTLGNLQTLEIPPREFVKCNESLIETVAIDPRCPTHKRKFIERWFKENGVRVVDSTCFGFTAFPHW